MHLKMSKNMATILSRSQFDYGVWLQYCDNNENISFTKRVVIFTRNDIWPKNGILLNQSF